MFNIKERLSHKTSTFLSVRVCDEYQECENASVQIPHVHGNVNVPSPLCFPHDNVDGVHHAYAYVRVLNADVGAYARNFPSV